MTSCGGVFLLGAIHAPSAPRPSEAAQPPLTSRQDPSPTGHSGLRCPGAGSGLRTAGRARAGRGRAQVRLRARPNSRRGGGGAAARVRVRATCRLQCEHARRGPPRPGTSRRKRLRFTASAQGAGAAAKGGGACRRAPSFRFGGAAGREAAAGGWRSRAPPPGRTSARREACSGPSDPAPGAGWDPRFRPPVPWRRRWRRKARMKTATAAAGTCASWTKACGGAGASRLGPAHPGRGGARGSRGGRAPWPPPAGPRQCPPRWQRRPRAPSPPRVREPAGWSSLLSFPACESFACPRRASLLSPLPPWHEAAAVQEGLPRPCRRVCRTRGFCLGALCPRPHSSSAGRCDARIRRLFESFKRNPI